MNYWQYVLRLVNAWPGRERDSMDKMMMITIDLVDYILSTADCDHEI